MGQLVFILGRSGTGKSYSMRNFPKDKLAVINVQGKILPFKGSGSITMENTDDSASIVKTINKFAKDGFKSIVVDDFQYVMANEFMRRATERGYDKFTEIARHAWDIADDVRKLPDDVIVYIMCHTDTDADGFEKLKTIGKLLDEKIVLEGMSTIVLKTAVSDGQYMFVTQNNGHDTVKSPAGMFPSYAIDNDLCYVDEKIRNYYELGEFLTDAEIKEIDEAVKKDNIPIKEKKSKRGRRKSVKEDVKEEREETEKENMEAIANANTTDDGEGVPIEEAERPEIKEPPKRKRRTAVNPPEEVETPEEPAEAPARRRRRRA